MKSIFLTILALSAGFILSAAENIPRISGSAADWQKTKGFQVIRWITNEKPDIPTTVKLGYDDSRLYVQAICSEPNMIEARQAVRYPRHDAPVWGNECIELFLKTDSTGSGYYQLVVDIHNQAADMRNSDPGFPRPNEWNTYWTHHVEYRPDGYTVNIAVPWKNIGVTPGKGRSIKLNLSRMRYISPAGRFVLSPRTTKQLHNPDNYLVISDLDIAAPALTAAVVTSAPQEGRNTMQLKLRSTVARPLSGKINIMVSDANGVETVRKSVPVKIAAKSSITKTIDWKQDKSGLFPVRATFIGSDKKEYDLYAATLRFNRPLELNETSPWVTCGKKYSLYCRIFTPGKNHKIDIKITDKKGKTVAKTSQQFKSNADFIALPCDKLKPGSYKVSFTLNNSFTETAALRIIPAIIR